MRDAVVSGSFYASDPDALKEQIRGCFLSRFGPGKLPGKASKELSGVICPHAGYVYSGPCAAHSYKAIAESKKPDLFIILGLSHAGFGNCLSLEDLRTPLGVAKVDKEFGKTLVKNRIVQDELAHEEEHSIEVQIPFLQYILEDFAFVPIIVSDYLRAAEAIKKTIAETGKKVIFIASSDFTHYGAAYGYMPFKTNVKQNMYRLDAGAIEQIKKINAKAFLEYTGKTRATICGRMPIAAMLSCIKAERAEFLKYYTSADISDRDYSMAVGYASIKFS